MRILMINYSEVTSPGGVHKTIMEVSKNLSKMGHEVTVLQGNFIGLPNEEDYKGFRIIRVKSKAADYLYGFSPEIYFYLKKHFKTLNPHIVHVHGYHTLFSPEVIYLIKKISPQTPIVFSPHFGIYSRSSFGGKYLWGVYNYLISQKIFNNSDVIITASKFEANNLIKTFKLPKKKIMIIPHGVTFINTKKNKKSNNEVNLLYVGYLLELKGVQYIFESLYELIYKNKVKSFLNIVGNGPYKEELKRLANDFDINKFIRWEGFITLSNSKKLLDLYKKSDILLLLSKSENYGIVVSEALAMGTPVIVTKRTALSEFLNEPGCFGVDFPPDPKEVVDLILKIYRSDMKVGPFSKKIRTWNEVTEDYEKLFIKLKGS